MGPSGIEKPKRQGTAFWVADRDGPLLRALAIAEDRTYPAIISRALRRYAAESQDYQEYKKEHPICDAKEPLLRVKVNIAGEDGSRRGGGGPRAIRGVYPRGQSAPIIKGAAEYLARIGRRANYKEITRALIEQGVVIKGKSPEKLVSAYLSQCRLFDNARYQGGYGLAEPRED